MSNSSVRTLEWSGVLSMQTLFMVFTYRVSWNFFFFFTKHDRILQDPSHLNSIRPYRGFTHFYPGLRSPFLFRVSDYKAASLKKKIFRRPFFSISFRCGFHFSSEFGVGTESLLDYCFFFVCLFFLVRVIIAKTLTERDRTSQERSRGISGKKKTKQKIFQ